LVRSTYNSLARQPCRNITNLITGRRPAELQAFFTAVVLPKVVLPSETAQTPNAGHPIYVTHFWPPRSMQM
jgi:hypothetical protein